jgi:hypothetical protein
MPGTGFLVLGARKRLRARLEACRSMMRSGEYVLSLAWTTRARRTRLWPGAHRAHASTHNETPPQNALSLFGRVARSRHTHSFEPYHTHADTHAQARRVRGRLHGFQQAPRVQRRAAASKSRSPPPRASCSPRTRGRRVWAPAPGCAPRACRRLYCAASAAAAAMASSAWRRAAASATRPLELSASVPGPEEAAPPSGLPSESA